MAEPSTSLTGMKCVACRGDEPTLSDQELAAMTPQIPDWEVVEIEGIKRLRRVFRFKDFASALRFTDQVGALAEDEGHHPALLTEWGKTTVSWWTHKIRGLHRNDAIMAAKTDRLSAGEAAPLSLGVQPGIDLTKALRLATELEDDETLRKLELRK